MEVKKAAGPMQKVLASLAISRFLLKAFSDLWENCGTRDVVAPQASGCIAATAASSFTLGQGPGGIEISTTIVANAPFRTPTQRGVVIDRISGASGQGRDKLSSRFETCIHMLAKYIKDTAVNKNDV